MVFKTSLLEANPISIKIYLMANRKLILSVLIFGLLLIGVLYTKKYPLPEEATHTKDQAQENQQLIIGGVHYLLDVSDNNPNQIKELLDRAEKLSTSSEPNEKASKVVMVIHGANVELFDKKNYFQNKSLIDQAARLDAFDVIDFKICQTAAASRGIKKTSFPSFLEVVSFAGYEIDRLEAKGYVEL